jgi:hypoxanthine phosphoribosyltransferase
MIWLQYNPQNQVNKSELNYKTDMDKLIFCSYNRPMPQPVVLISRGQIKQTVTDLAKKIRKDYKGKEPLLIGVLKGSSIFFADLIRELDMPLEIEFVRLSSYGAAKESAGKVKILHGLRTPIKGKDVLIVEDIVDTGLTITALEKYLRKKKPASIRLCSLLDKPSRRKVDVTIDYVGFKIHDRFVVGYGIDWNEHFRYLPDIAVID